MNQDDLRDRIYGQKSQEKQKSNDKHKNLTTQDDSRECLYGGKKHEEQKSNNYSNLKILNDLRERLYGEKKQEEQKNNDNYKNLKSLNDLREELYGQKKHEEQKGHEEQKSNDKHKSHKTKSYITIAPESAITIIANIILVLGCIGTIISAYNTLSAKEFNPLGLTLTLTILFSTILQWIFMKVISNTIKEINKKLK